MNDLHDMEHLLVLLGEVITEERALTPETELLASGLLDSFALVELLDRLEDEWGVTLYPSRLPRETFSTAAHLHKAILDAE